jgi:hypothetical protein
LIAPRHRRPAPDPSPPPAVPPPTIPPPLSLEGRRELDRVVAVLAGAGVFVPQPPDPAHLAEAVADHGEPVTAFAALSALHEADHYHPQFRMAHHDANLAFHDSHVEQDMDVLREQAADLIRLAGGGLTGVPVTVEIDTTGSTQTMPTHAVPTRIRVGERVLDYAGDVKYLSTVLHVELATVLRERGTGRRLAWLWSDQGVWLTGVADGEVERLNTALGPAAEEGWEWVDEQPPMAAGELR